MASRSKRKGDAGEREVAELLTAAGYSTTRSRQGAGGDDGGPDVLAHGFRSKLCVESKRVGKNWPDFFAALDQASEWRNDDPHTFACARVRRDREDGLFVMRDVDFVDLVGHLQQLERRVAELSIEIARLSP